MKFQVVSDLHIEKHRYDNFPVCAENLIIAGDLGRIGKEYTLAIEYFCSLYKRVILVLGNHEYIGQEVTETEAYFASLQSIYPNLRVLENDTMIVDGIMIFGATFWSHVLTEPATDIQFCGQRISRFQWNALHHQSVVALENAIEISKKKNVPLVVVTHFSPLGGESVDPKYRTEENFEKNLFYFTNSILRHEKTIQTWIYGHTGYNYSSGKFVTNQLVSNGGKQDFCIEVRSQ